MKAGGSSTIPPETVVGTAVSADKDVTTKAELESKLDQAREQLIALRRQQDELERQKGEIEELRRKQDEYTRGKAEMIDNLTRGLTLVEREQIKSQRTAQVCTETHTAFRDYLDQVQSLNEETWTSTTLRTELSRALGIIENARLEYNRARTRLDCFTPEPEQPATPVAAEPQSVDWDEILRYARLGAAASAPLILAGTIWVILLIAAK
jgi:chromosome segregation ATPase